MPVILVAALGTWHSTAEERRPRPPGFQVDPSWPQPLRNNWILGQIGGITVDSKDHIWVYQRPRSIVERYLGPLLTPPRST
jgi:hypothetical protein